MMRLAALCVLIFLSAAGNALYAQQPPKADPHTPRPADGENRRKAAALTESVFPSTVSGPAAPVARRNFIDEFIFSRMQRDGVPHAPLSSDEEFFRRIHIDLTGRIPDHNALGAFLANTDPAKRDRVIDALLNSQAFKAKWTYWFMDLSKTAANRVGGPGKNVYYSWVYDNLHINRPYNEMVSDLLTANAVSNWNNGPASYVARWVVIGLSCEDEVHEDTADELAINSVKHFLGVDLQCVSCHDGAHHLEKINLWLSQRKRQQLWETAAFFAKTRVLRRTEIAVTRDEYSIDDQGSGYDASARTVVRVPRRGKGVLDPVFLFTGATADPSRPLRPQYAKILTEHPQFARTAVNLFWSEFFGAGIVDPVLDFDLARQDPGNPPPAPWTIQPTHPELLNALAEDFRTHNHDLKRLFRLITTSSAYQLSSSYGAAWKEAYSSYFARKFVRRLKAEEIHDSLLQATSLYTPIPIRGTDITARFATEARSPEDFKQEKITALRDANFFMESFGQTNREYSERTNEGDITQAILLMNSPFVLNRTKPLPGSFLKELLSKESSPDADRITALFQRFLVRAPRQEELAQAKDIIATSGARGWEDLQWLLINKVEFLFNY
ncbi:MAG: DUF1553 domain-containing protein [Acidobacteriia bacterium]|nr:DUF1553 domain-containing protein [Terriglobia bacterium]